MRCCLAVCCCRTCLDLPCVHSRLTIILLLRQSMPKRVVRRSHSMLLGWMAGLLGNVGLLGGELGTSSRYALRRGVLSCRPFRVRCCLLPWYNINEEVKHV